MIRYVFIPRDRRRGPASPADAPGCLRLLMGPICEMESISINKTAAGLGQRDTSSYSGTRGGTVTLARRAGATVDVSCRLQIRLARLFNGGCVRNNPRGDCGGEIGIRRALIRTCFGASPGPDRSR